MFRFGAPVAAVQGRDTELAVVGNPGLPWKGSLAMDHTSGFLEWNH